MILKTHPDNPNIRHIRLAIDALESGELIAYATDTVYGLGCDVIQQAGDGEGAEL